MPEADPLVSPRNIPLVLRDTQISRGTEQHTWLDNTRLR